jgi:hypothetical protein
VEGARVTNPTQCTLIVVPLRRPLASGAAAHLSVARSRNSLLPVRGRVARDLTHGCRAALPEQFCFWISGAIRQEDACPWLGGPGSQEAEYLDFIENRSITAGTCGR